MPVLYLDTARLGQTSPSALQAQIDFARLTAKEPSGLYFDRFLRDGIRACPDSWARDYPGLSCWNGVTELKQAIKQATDAPPDHRVLLASRTANLMRFAARRLFQACGNVLSTDLSWPTYAKTLRAVASRCGAMVTTLPLRSAIFNQSSSVDEIINRFVRGYRANHCDGLFLPAVNHLGVRLPIRDIVRSIKRDQNVAFVVIDGAQAVGHLPNLDLQDDCDLLIGGTHKWIRAYAPMGFAVYGQSFLGRHKHSVAKGLVKHDPLTRFTSEIVTGRPTRYSETVNLGPMFACRGALEDLPVSSNAKASRFAQQRDRSNALSQIACERGWRVWQPDTSLRSGILLIQPEHTKYQACTRQLRQSFADCSVSVTTYRDCLVRLSSPTHALSEADQLQMQQALEQ